MDCKYTITTVMTENGRDFFHTMSSLTYDQLLDNMAKTGYLYPERFLAVEEWAKSGSTYPHRDEDFAGRSFEVVRE